MTHVSNEEIAHQIVHLYFQEIARLGIKRRLDLDEVVQAYFYTLNRLNAGSGSTGHAHTHPPKGEASSETAHQNAHEKVQVTVSHDEIECEEPHHSGDLAPPPHSTEPSSSHSRSFHS
jgi:hypothetical protein